MIAAIALAAVTAARGQSNNVTLIWDPNTESDLAGYKMYYGPASGTYTNVTDVGNITTNTVMGLITATTYYFAVTAYNTSGLESGFSNEVNYTPGTNAVNSVNAPPTLDTISNVVLNENAGVQSVGLTGISSGSTNEVQTLTVTAVSDNPSVVPTPTIIYTSPNTNGTLSFTPAANAFGTANITVTVNDGGATNNLTSQTFSVTINWVNQPPTLNALTNLALAENTGLQTVALSGISSGATNEQQVLTVTAVSDNLLLIPTPTVTYSSPSTTGTLTFAPLALVTGTANLTVTVNDGGPTNNVVSRSFAVTVTQDTPPVISAIANQTLQKNLSGLPIPFTVGDAETAASNLVLSASSSNTNLIAGTGIIFGGSGTNRTVTLTPNRGQVGVATITVRVSDGILGAASLFTLTVVANTPHIVYLGPGNSFAIVSMSIDPVAGTTVTWNSTVGSVYHLLSKDALDAATWTDLSGPITAVGATTSWTDVTAPGVSARFYRVSN